MGSFNCNCPQTKLQHLIHLSKGMPRFKPEAAGWEARLLPLCYAPPPKKKKIRRLVRTQKKFQLSLTSGEGREWWKNRPICHLGSFLSALWVSMGNVLVMLERLTNYKQVIGFESHRLLALFYLFLFSVTCSQTGPLQRNHITDFPLKVGSWNVVRLK